MWAFALAALTVVLPSAAATERSFDSGGVEIRYLDMNGGASGKPHDPAAYGEEMARDIVALLDHAGIARAHLVGYSMGGLATLKAITLAPERFASAVVGGQGWAGNASGRAPPLTQEAVDATNAGKPTIRWRWRR